MRVQSANGRVELPEGMRSKLESFRRHLWWIKLGEGVFAGLVGLLISYAIVFALDRFWDTPAAVRGAILIIGSLGLGVIFPLKCHRWIWRTRQLEQVARLLRHKLPHLGDQLLGIVELAHAQRNDQVCSESLVRAAIEQVDREIADREFHDAVPNPRLRTWGIAAACLAALIVATFAIVPAAGTNALLRWLLPWKHTDRYTFAQLEELPPSMIVPYAEDFSLSVSLAEDSDWSPDAAYAAYGSQESVRSDLADGGYHFQLPPQKDEGELKVSVGDARTALTVLPTMRPELTDVQAHVTLPAYLQYSRPLSQDVRGGTISLVKNSRVSLAATATRGLAGASLDGVPQSTQGNRLVTADRLITESSTHELSWQDELQLQGKRPLVITIKAEEDQAPNITCRDLSFEQVVLDSDVLTFEIGVADDFGVKSVGMEWAGIGNRFHNPNPAQGEKVLMGGEPEKRDMAVSATFSAKREGIPAQSLRVRIYAEDYLPDRGRVYSPEYVIHVLDPEQHAIWLTRRLQRWFRQAQDVYEQEQSLHRTNVELRSLPAEALDQPENRRRIETQAAAERTNARRLELVSDAGEELIRQAMRNDQFNVATLETWAEMLNALRDIAEQRMPSVADLLDEAAGAAAGQGEPKEGSASQVQAESSPRVGNVRDAGAGGAGAPKEGETASVPGISDIESGFNEPTPRSPQDQSPSQASSGRLGLPVTTLMGGPAGPAPPPAESPAQEQMEMAVQQQEDLLEEFARVAEELQRILDNLEGSTFVKRLKAASRKQMSVAVDLATAVSAAFGADAEQLNEAATKRTDRLAELEYALSYTVWDIRSDLKAYYNRVRDGKFKVVLDEMDAESVVSSLGGLGDTIGDNYVGQANAQAEFWGDTLDRWAEQLVGPACPGGAPPPPANGDSLPPAIVLEVMKILEKEIDLREETRAAEFARPTLEPAEHGSRATSLADTQDEIGQMVADVVRELREMPNAASFGQEIGLLSRVEQVMRDAQQLLAAAETGPPAIAAETEAIELLLQSRRAGGGGGGGGGWTPGGGGGGDTDQSALALLGSGAERQSRSQARVTGQATGTTGSQYPAEFRAGLDAFFSGLEGMNGAE